MVDNARQRLNWESGNITFAAFEIIRQDIRSERADMPDPGVEREATQIWEAECFGLELFEVDGVAKTKAEAFAGWRRHGHSQSECLRYWVYCQFIQIPDEKRKIDKEWKSGTLEIIRKDLARAADAGVHQ